LAITNLDYGKTGTISSSLALKELLGEIRLEPVTEKELRPEDIINGIASGPSRDRLKQLLICN
jgi:hypothetical protein